MSFQYNENRAASINIQGDHNVIEQSNEVSIAKDIIAVLKEYGEIEKATALESDLKSKGARSALKKAIGWVSAQVFSPPVLASLAPHIANAAIV